MSTEIRVWSTHAAMDVLNAFKPSFERDTGIGLDLVYDPGRKIRRELENGAFCDVAIMPRTVSDALVEQNLMLDDSRTDVGRCGLGVSVREGAPLPDISTVEALKQTFLAAESVVRSTDGASGHHFDTLLDRFGIRDAMKDKIVMGPSGRVAELVARGEAALAISKIPELLPVKGARYVGPYPEEVQHYTMFCAGITTQSKQAEAARKFITAITTPDMLAQFKSAGIEPL